MKNSIVLLYLIICTSTLSFTSCHSTAGTGDERADLVKQKLIERITNESHEYFSLVSFTKTNGTEQNFLGSQMYELEFTCAVRTDRECWKIGNGVTGFFADFSAEGIYPTQEKLRNAMGEAREFQPGTINNLKGKATLVKKDNGWSVESLKVF